MFTETFQTGARRPIVFWRQFQTRRQSTPFQNSVRIIIFWQGLIIIEAFEMCHKRSFHTPFLLSLSLYLTLSLFFLKLQSVNIPVIIYVCWSVSSVPAIRLFSYWFNLKQFLAGRETGAKCWVCFGTPFRVSNRLINIDKNFRCKLVYRLRRWRQKKQTVERLVPLLERFNKSIMNLFNDLSINEQQMKT